jgi:hypothetical protein
MGSLARRRWWQHGWPESRSRADPTDYAITVHARNGSAEPVYDVVVTTDVGVRGTFDRHHDVLGPATPTRSCLRSARNRSGGPLSMMVRDCFLLEDGSGGFQLEDGSGSLLVAERRARRFHFARRLRRPALAPRIEYAA